MYFLGIGYCSIVSKKRATYSISISKAIAVGSGLRKGIKLYSYLAEDKGRKVIITYLDGNERKP